MAPTQDLSDFTFEELQALILADHQRDIARRSQEPPVGPNIIAPQDTAHVANVADHCPWARIPSVDATEISDVSAETSTHSSPFARPLDGDASNIDSFFLSEVHASLHGFQGLKPQDSDDATDAKERSMDEDLSLILWDFDTAEMLSYRTFDTGMYGELLYDAFSLIKEDVVPQHKDFVSTLPMLVRPSGDGMDIEVFLKEGFDPTLSINDSFDTTGYPNLNTAGDGTDVRQELNEHFDDASTSYASFLIPEDNLHLSPGLDTTENASITFDSGIDSSYSSDPSINENLLLTCHDVLEQFQKDFLSSKKTDLSPTGSDVKNEFGYTDDDVLFGRGPRVNNHPGNQKLRKRADRLRVVYLSTRKKKVKTTVSQLLVDSFILEGARFLKKCSTTGRWTAVLNKDARIKACQVLCQGYDPHVGAIKRLIYPKRSGKKKSSRKK